MPKGGSRISIVTSGSPDRRSAPARARVTPERSRRRRGTASHRFCLWRRIVCHMWNRLMQRIRRRRKEHQQIAARWRQRLRAGELPPDDDAADRNVVGGALSQRPH